MRSPKIPVQTETRETAGNPWTGCASGSNMLGVSARPRRQAVSESCAGRFNRPDSGLKTGHGLFAHAEETTDQATGMLLFRFGKLTEATRAILSTAMKSGGLYGPCPCFTADQSGL